MTLAMYLSRLACFAVLSLLLASQKIQTRINKMSEMAAKFLKLFWKSHGILARRLSKILVKSLYQKYISGYHPMQCVATDLFVVQVRLIHMV